MSYYSVKNGNVYQNGGGLHKKCSKKTLKNNMMKGGSIVYDLLEKELLYIPKNVKVTNRNDLLWGNAVNVAPKEITLAPVDKISEVVKSLQADKENVSVSSSSSKITKTTEEEVSLQSPLSKSTQDDKGKVSLPKKTSTFNIDENNNVKFEIITEGIDNLVHYKEELKELYKDLPIYLQKLDSIDIDKLTLSDGFHELDNFMIMSNLEYEQLYEVVNKFENSSEKKKLLEELEYDESDKWIDKYWVHNIRKRINNLQYIPFSIENLNKLIKQLEPYNINLGRRKTLAKEAGYDKQLYSSFTLITLLKRNQSTNKQKDFNKLQDKLNIIKEKGDAFCKKNGKYEGKITEAIYFGTNKLDRSECEKKLGDNLYKLASKKPIGKGSFGIVTEICQGLDECQKGNYKYVVKVQEFKQRNSEYNFNNEVNINKLLQKDGLAVKIIDDWICNIGDKKYGYMIMEKWDGTIDNYFVENKTKKLPKEKIDGLFNQLMKIHDKKLLHTDIKSNNIFYRKDDFIIADFGNTEIIDEDYTDYLIQTLRLFDVFKLYQVFKKYIRNFSSSNLSSKFREYFARVGNNDYIYDNNNSDIIGLSVRFNKENNRKEDIEFKDTINNLLFTQDMIEERMKKTKHFNNKAKNLNINKTKQYKDLCKNYNEVDDVSKLQQAKNDLDLYLKNTELAKIFTENIGAKCTKLDKTCGTDTRNLCEKKLIDFINNKNLLDDEVYNSILTEINTLGQNVKNLFNTYEARKKTLISKITEGKENKKKSEELYKKTCNDLEIILQNKKVKVKKPINSEILKEIEEIFRESEKEVEKVDLDKLKDYKQRIDIESYSTLEYFCGLMTKKYPPRKTIKIGPEPSSSQPSSSQPSSSLSALSTVQKASNQNKVTKNSSREDKIAAIRIIYKTLTNNTNYTIKFSDKTINDIKELERLEDYRLDELFNGLSRKLSSLQSQKGGKKNKKYEINTYYY